jgi:hypothetical protein
MAISRSRSGVRHTTKGSAERTWGLTNGVSHTHYFRVYIDGEDVTYYLFNIAPLALDDSPLVYGGRPTVVAYRDLDITTYCKTPGMHNIEVRQEDGYSDPIDVTIDTAVKII